MLTGTKLKNALVDDLNELGLPNMAATLETLYQSETFLKMDRLSLIAELIGPEYEEKKSKRVNNRLRHAKLMGCPQQLSECVDSQTREYLPNGIVEILSSLAFVDEGLNLCILGPSDSGKTYLAKAFGIAACQQHKVEYYHSETFAEGLVALKNGSYEKYERKLRSLQKLDLLILDDFLLHTIADERDKGAVHRLRKAV